MNKQKRGILVGMLLGDGYIRLTRHKCKNGKISKYAELKIGHSEKQLRYLQWKASKLHSILGGKPFKILECHTTLSNGKKYSSFEIRRQHKYFKFLHRIAYSNSGKKHFTRKLLDYLTPEGIAYWFQDDGSLVKNYNNAGEVSSFQIRLYTYCSKQECETMQKYFNEVWNIHFNIKKHTGKEQYNLRANTKEANKFLKLVYSYKVPSMEYKFLEPRVQGIS